MSFIPAKWLEDGTYRDKPAGIVQLTDAETAEYHGANPPAGKALGSLKGRPVWVDAAPPSLEDVLAARKSAYRRRSDDLKIQAEYDAEVSGKPVDYSGWVAEVQAIKAEYPKPREGQ